MEMSHLIGVVLSVSLVWFAAFFQLSIILWSALIGVGLLILTLIGWLPLIAMLIFWPLYLLAALISNLPSLRRRFIIQPALTILKNKIPTISKTEREAIEAGNTWWEKELFCGRPHWKTLFSYPEASLSTEEEKFLNNQVETLCAMLNDWEIVYDEQNMPEAVWQYLKKEKFFGLVIPKQYGGLGFSAYAHSCVIVKIASRSISAAVNTMVPNSLGPGELLLQYGTDEQKTYYLPRLAKGEDIPCFALTAPEAGSDAASIPDNGIVCKQKLNGKEQIGIRLSWDKRYITLAPVATVLGLAIHLYDPEHILGNVEDVGITLCLIPTNHPGVEIGHRHYPLYTAFMNGPTRGKDVFIPMDWIIGGPSKAGQGWQMLMECLSIGRAISLPGLATASGQVAYRYTGAYAKIRRQFHVSISAFEGIQESLGYIAGYTYILEACRTMTASAVDQHIKPAIASAIAKYHMTEISRKIITHAMDVHAGQMVQIGPRNFLANIYMAIPISITVEGANILTRNLIIFGQGAIRCHPYLLKEVALISHEKTDIAALDKVLISHVGFFISNLLRNIAYGISGGKLIFSSIKNRRIRSRHKQLTRMSAALALLADTSVILMGGSLKRRERLSARLGDILSYLYLASTVLKYYKDNGSPESDVENVEWALQYCLANIQVASDGLTSNFPVPIVGKLLRWLIFPLGTAYAKPSDEIHAKILVQMLSSSALRDRLTAHVYQSKDATDPSFRLNAALAQADAMEPLLRKLHKATQSGRIPAQFGFNERLQAAVQDCIVSAEEAQALSTFEALHNEIIKVNEFTFDLNKVIT